MNVTQCQLSFIHFGVIYNSLKMLNLRYYIYQNCPQCIIITKGDGEINDGK